MEASFHESIKGVEKFEVPNFLLKCLTWGGGGGGAAWYVLG